MSDVRTTVNRYIGIPYDETGDHWSGVYCLGLAILFYRTEYGVEIPNPCTHDPDLVTRSVSSYFVPVKLPEFGDLAQFDCADGTGHVGIWTPLGIIHAARKTGVVCQPARRFANLRYYRLKP